MLHDITKVEYSGISKVKWIFTAGHIRAFQMLVFHCESSKGQYNSHCFSSTFYSFLTEYLKGLIFHRTHLQKCYIPNVCNAHFEVIMSNFKCRTGTINLRDITFG